MKPGARLVAALILAAGCANLPYDPAGQIPGTANPGTEPGGVIPTAHGRTAQSGSREVCRGAAIPRGWIAVDYVASSVNCRNSMRDSGANTAIIVRYETLPPETILLVCTDQHLPYQWARLPPEDTDASSTQCPARPAIPGPVRPSSGSAARCRDPWYAAPHYPCGEPGSEATPG